MFQNKLFQTRFKEYAIITVVLLIDAIGWTGFLIPSKIVGAGVSGLATIIYFASDIPVGISYFSINLLLVMAGFKYLGGDFGFKTIYSIVVLSVSIYFFQRWIPEPFVQDRFMAAIIGATLVGASVGIVFNQGGSTGGTDIIAKLITSHKNISPGRIILMCDILIISSSFLVFRSIEFMMYGFVTMAVTAYVIDLIIVGASQSVQMFVFSKNHEGIAENISTNLKRGVTLLDGTGWYTKEQVKVVLVVVRKYEVQNAFKIIKQTDPDAFISLGSVIGVYGKGFDKLKT